MASICYPLKYRLDNTEGYLIWFSNDPDGLIGESDDTIPCFRDQATARIYALAHLLDLDDSEPVLHNLDVISQWVSHATAADVDAPTFLGAWNLFTDLANSVRVTFSGDQEQTKHIYDKLFWGSNLPSVTPSDEHYAPIWTNKELSLMQSVFTEGLHLFRSYVRAI